MVKQLQKLWENSSNEEKIETSASDDKFHPRKFQHQQNENIKFIYLFIFILAFITKKMNSYKNLHIEQRNLASHLMVESSLYWIVLLQLKKVTEINDLSIEDYIALAKHDICHDMLMFAQRCTNVLSYVNELNAKLVGGIQNESKTEKYQA
ncbi:hypothetical protein RFI_22543 [Reticulomyxa filosa]|uniref:Uncharacterized protein n=1 Tax=Reticulomyxa filosa TaxID=46433 RepID=X6MP18_RETFI|nr:hypothetical protein RFI_22543 [Reticulomyxa filosa]|eukprot:ETO14825.1 hypothetical protein RFI_22543 [Reticulomyxa filosa]